MFSCILQVKPLTRKNFELVHLFINFFLVLELVNGLNGKGGAMKRCPNFLDKRSNPIIFRNGSHTGIGLEIPAYLSSRGKVLHVKLTTGDLNCGGEAHTTEVLFQSNLTKFSSVTSLARNFETVQEAVISSPNYFTSDGHFFDGKYFLSPKTDFCVSSISDTKLELLTCSQICGGNTKVGGDNKSTICFPKCCAIDEAFLWTQCVKINDTGETGLYWEPELYRTRWHEEFEFSRMPNEDLENRIKFFLADIPYNCNAGPNYTMEVKVGEWEGESNEDDQPYFQYYSSVMVESPYGDGDLPKDPVRLTLDKNGKVKPWILYATSRTWVALETVKFCADAVMIKENGDRIKSDSFILFYCSKAIDDDIVDSAFQKSTVYTVFSFLSMPFLMFTVAIYVALLDKLNLHGLIILSYSIAECMAYVLLIMAQLVFLDHWEWIGIRERGWPCYVIAISAHYFYLSSQFWLLAMNCDLWMTFKSFPVVKKESKELKKFSFYSIVSWGLPLILVGSFITVDEVYRDPILEVPVPDYANSACFVSPDFRGYYVHLPVAILLSLNVVLILLTMKILIETRKENKKSMGNSSACINASKYSVKLFAKLFIVMGGAYLIDFLSWYFTKTEEKKPWIVVCLESVSYLIPIILFYLFCLNDKTLNRLMEKFPRLRCVILPLKRILKRGDRRSSKPNDIPANGSNNKRESVPLKPTNFGKRMEQKHETNGYTDGHN